MGSNAAPTKERREKLSRLGWFKTALLALALFLLNLYICHELFRIE
jgi:hypothetical protein